MKEIYKNSQRKQTILFFFFLHCAQCFTYPSPFSILFPSSFFSFSLLHNFIILPPQCFYSLLHRVLLFSLLNVFYSPPPPPPPHLFYIFFYPQIHRPPSDSTSTPHRPYIDPTSTPHRHTLCILSTESSKQRLTFLLDKQFFAELSIDLVFMFCPTNEYDFTFA